MKKDWPLAVAQALADALTGFMTLQARQGLSAAYSEYLLYDPIVRVARYRGWVIRSEWPLDKEASRRGDARRIDFRILTSQRAKRALLLEVKYRKSSSGVVDVRKDVEKLRQQLKRETAGSRALLLIAGRERRSGKAATAGFDTKPQCGETYYRTTYRAAHTTFGVSVFEVTAG